MGPKVKEIARKQCWIISSPPMGWAFGTDVMVTVAKSFEAPIKLVFPQDILENGLNASNFAMLGLGDIVIPGIFIALLLRYDVSLSRSSHTVGPRAGRRQINVPIRGSS